MDQSELSVGRGGLRSEFVARGACGVHVRCSRRAVLVVLCLVCVYYTTAFTCIAMYIYTHICMYSHAFIELENILMPY